MARGFVTSAGMRRRKAFAKRQKGSRRALVNARRIATDDQRFRAPVPLTRGPSYGFPDKLVTRLRYCDHYTLTGNAGVIGNQVMRANSCFDPDLTGVGHKPMWFDQFCGASPSAPYGRYRVIGSKIKATFSTSSPPSLVATNVGPIVVYILKDNNSTLNATSDIQIRETSGSKFAFISDKSGGHNVATVVNTYSPNRDIGMAIGDDTIEAPYNANPSQGYYWHVGKIDDTGAGAVVAYVEIEYLVEFFQRNEINVS